MSEGSRRPWFAPKSYGYGAGLPIAWQGWLALALFVIGMTGAPFVLRGVWLAVAYATLVAALVVVAVRRTRGGWRWRWGGED